MTGYDSWHQDHDDDCECTSCSSLAVSAGMMGITSVATRKTNTKEREALVDIANDCGTLEAAQRRAKEAL